MTALPATPLAPPSRLAFDLPPALEASEPPEARGLTRDAVRMMVAHIGENTVEHSTFTLLPAFLAPGDLVVVNTSGTIPAAVDAVGDDGTAVVVHLSTQLDSTGRDSTGLDSAQWVVEPRRPAGAATERWTGAAPPRHLSLAGDANMTLVSGYGSADRLYTAELRVPGRLLSWLAVHGRPIRYGYVRRDWPIAMYQNVYATEPGSAEMPSAGRPFTADIVMRLVSKGVGVTPLVLHTGVASLEADELPYPERLSVPPATAARVNATHDGGGRVVAVGTTVVRALESAAGPDGRARSVDGWTDLVVTPERGVRIVDGLLTGWHEPQSSHLMMLEAIAGRDVLETSYQASLDEGYLWHEFGDSHLILP